MQLQSVQQKQQDAIFEKYGVYFSIQNSDIAEKIKNTNLDRYGYENASKSPEIIEKIQQSQKEEFYQKLINRLAIHNIRPISSIEDFNFAYNQTLWICDNCNTQFESFANNNGRIPRCPTCYPEHISAGQVDVINYIVSILGKDPILINDRTILLNSDKRKSKELDILIKTHSLAIEYCGLRWHTETFGNKSESYHYLKWKRCEEANIQLLTIYSDEWYNHTKLIQSMIAVKLGISNKIDSELTNIHSISTETAKSFFEYNHINGHVDHTINFALMLNNVPILCMSFIKSTVYELVRIATIRNTEVVNGEYKLFSYFVREFNLDFVISSCDLRFDSGKNLEKLGFIRYLDPIIKFQYVEIEHPYCRYEKFSEGYDKLWDCGHQKYIWKNK